MRRQTQILQRAFIAGLLLCVSAWLSMAAAERPSDVLSGDEAKMVNRFTVYVPSSPADCDRKNPWAAGRWKLNDLGAVPSGGCLALNYSLRDQAYVVLLHQAPGGALTRLAPAGCEQSLLSIAEAGEHWFPESRRGRERIIELDGEIGMENFYLLAMAEANSYDLFSQITAVPPLEGGCESEVVGPNDMAELMSLVESSEGAVEWHIQSVEHY